jgi:OOP family OmpA-OmpF porin
MMRKSAFAIAISFAVLAVAKQAAAQQQLNQGDIISSLAGSGQAASASGLDLLAIRDDIERRIQVEGTENAASPPPVLQALATLPNLTVEIEFAFDSDWIRPVSWGTMGDIAEALHHPLLLTYKFAVVGHTDAKGSREYNLKLSQRRAEAVANMLATTFKIDPNRLVAVGFGEEQLQDPSNPDAAVNRRVQLLNVGPL